MKTLSIYYENQEVGTLRHDEHGIPELEYTANWQRNGFDISVTLPRLYRRHTGPIVQAFFENILPEGPIRRILAKKIGTSENNISGILSHIGKDCAGAFSIGAPGSNGSYKPLSEAEIQKLLKDLPQFPLAIKEQRTSLSLAGAQHKLPLFYKDGTYYLPQDGASSNCILKLPIPGFVHTVENEHFCLQLAKHIGLPTVISSIIKLGDLQVLHVDRYDREGADFHPRRLPQEDFCQMTGKLSSMKYERDGGPSFYDCGTLIKRHSARPAVDLRLLVKWTAFNLCIGNNDAHAKNLSMLRIGNGLSLAPFYDLLTTTYYGHRLLRRLAMHIGGKKKSFFISHRRWSRFARDIQIPEKSVIKLVTKTARDILDNIDTFAGQFAPEHSTTISNLADHIRQRSQRVIEQISSTRNK